MDWLRHARVEATGRPLLFHHPANGGYRNKREAVRLKLYGVQPGTPDIKIDSILARDPSARGIDLEIKRQRGGALSTEQRYMLRRAQEESRLVKTALGAKDGIEFCEQHGIISEVKFVWRYDEPSRAWWVITRQCNFVPTKDARFCPGCGNPAAFGKRVR